MKLERSALAHYLNPNPSSVTEAWWRIGKDVESMSVELGSEIETKRNILDETSVSHNGNTPSMSVDTYYANPDDEIYTFIRNMALDRKKGDDCKTKILEVIIEDTEATNHLAYKEDVVIEVSSYGGETGGISIPFTIHFAGNRKKGYVTIDSSTKAPTFTEGSIPG